MARQKQTARKTVVKDVDHVPMFKPIIPVPDEVAIRPRASSPNFNPNSEFLMVRNVDGKIEKKHRASYEKNALKEIDLTGEFTVVKRYSGQDEILAADSQEEVSSSNNNIATDFQAIIEQGKEKYAKATQEDYQYAKSRREEKEEEEIESSSSEVPTPRIEDIEDEDELKFIHGKESAARNFGMTRMRLWEDLKEGKYASTNQYLYDMEEEIKQLTAMLKAKQPSILQEQNQRLQAHIKNLNLELESKKRVISNLYERMSQVEQAIVLQHEYIAKLKIIAKRVKKNE